MDREEKKRLKRRAKEILSEREAALREPTPDLETAAHYDLCAQLSGINAYLLALEALYEDAYTSATFRYERVADADADPRLAVTEHLDPRYRIDLIGLSNWQRELASALPPWIFGQSPLTEAAKVRMIETLVVLVARATGDTSAAWRVEVDTAKGPFYEAAFADYVFASPRGLYLLHFGISD